MSLVRSIAWLILGSPLAGCAGADPTLPELAPLEDSFAGLSSPSCKAVRIDAFSTEADEGRLVFSWGGDEAYFHRVIDGRPTIMESHRAGATWSAPVVASFSGRWADLDPFISLDGRTLYFASLRPVDANGAPRPDADLWKVSRASFGWGAPVRLSEVDTDHNELFPSLTLDGTLYFNSDRPGGKGAWDIYRARPRRAAFAPPEVLPGGVNTPIWEFNPSPSPLGSALAFASLDPDPLAPYSDIFFSFKARGSYSKRVNAGPCINSELEEYHPTLDVARSRLVFVRNDPSSPTNGDFYEVRLPGDL